jgi:Zn-dependent oligopeptidase
MYATVFKADPLDPGRGQRYRDKILLPGGSQDDIESLKVESFMFVLRDDTAR